MGWGSGMGLMCDVIEVVLSEVDSFDTRKKIYQRLIPLWQTEGCDNIDECRGSDVAFREAYDEIDPSILEDESLDELDAEDDDEDEDEWDSELEDDPEDDDED